MSTLSPYCFFDLPRVLTCADTPIPKSSSSVLQVILDTGGKPGVGISYKDTSGSFIEVYIGASGQEKLLCHIGKGVSGIEPARIAKNSRISLRSATNTDITDGQLTVALVCE